jgi:hypothetical protein
MIMHLQYISMSISKISCHNSGEGIEIIYVRFALDKVTLGEVCLTVRVLRLCMTVLRLCLTVLRLCMTVLRICLTVLRLCVTVLRLCLTVLRLCMTVLRVCLTVLRLSPVSNVPPMVRTPLRLNTTFTKRYVVEAWERWIKAMPSPI